MHKTKTSEYKAWARMKHRCYCKSYDYYKDYGGRGISVCDRWMNSYDNFIEDMGVKPDLSYQLDRIDNDSGYEPKNCRWVPCIINIHNRSITKLSIKDNIDIVNRYVKSEASYQQIASEYCVDYSTIYSIVKKYKNDMRILYDAYSLLQSWGNE